MSHQQYFAKIKNVEFFIYVLHCFSLIFSLRVLPSVLFSNRCPFSYITA